MIKVFGRISMPQIFIDGGFLTAAFSIQGWHVPGMVVRSSRMESDFSPIADIFIRMGILFKVY